MRADVVVDVGNTRIKWGRCARGAVREAVSLPPEDVSAWVVQRDRWDAGRPLAWVISGVHPPHRDRLAEWVRGRGDTVFLLTSAGQLPLHVRLEHPDRAGIDRLLDAVAANQRRVRGVPAAIIDAGSAVTVDWVDAEGAFCGGAIFPGIRLMARALNAYTALLPVVEVGYPPPAMPAPSTRLAMQAGIHAAVIGGIETLLRELTQGLTLRAEIYLGGGDGPTLEPGLNAALKSAGAPPAVLWPEMTLEGIRLAAERLP